MESNYRLVFALRADRYWVVARRRNKIEAVTLLVQCVIGKTDDD